MGGKRPRRIGETRFDGSRMQLSDRSRVSDAREFLYMLVTLACLAFFVTWKAVPWFERQMMDPQELAAIESSVYYAGCNEVRAQGKAPLYRGDPGYGAHMDGDGDGIACEPYY